MPTHRQTQTSTYFVCSACEVAERIKQSRVLRPGQSQSSLLPVPEVQGQQQDKRAPLIHVLSVSIYFCLLSNTMTTHTPKLTRAGSDKHFNKCTFNHCCILKASQLVYCGVKEIDQSFLCVIA